MKPRIIFASFVLSVGFSMCATATSIGAKHLNIRQILDKPAACLPEDAGESIELNTAFVTGDSPEVPRQWAIQLIPGSKPLVLHSGECIAFGQSIDGYRQLGEFHALEEGQTYDFGLRRNDRLNDWVSKVYVGLFCVQRAPDGHLTYLPYVYHSNGTIIYPPCGHYVGLPPAPDGISPPRPASSYPINAKP